MAGDRNQPARVQQKGQPQKKGEKREKGKGKGRNKGKMKVVRLKERRRLSTEIDRQHELLIGIKKRTQKIILMKIKTKTKKRKTREKTRNIMMKVCHHEEQDEQEQPEYEESIVKTFLASMNKFVDEDKQEQENNR